MEHIDSGLWRRNKKWKSEVVSRTIIKFEWNSGKVEEWKSGGVEEWWSGRVVEWKSGGVEEWKSGGVEEWKNMIAPRSIHRELFKVEMKKNQ